MVVRCLDDDPDQRPPIQEVTQMIKSLKVMLIIVIYCYNDAEDTFTEISVNFLYSQKNLRAL